MGYYFVTKRIDLNMAESLISIKTLTRVPVPGLINSVKLF